MQLCFLCVLATLQVCHVETLPNCNFASLQLHELVILELCNLETFRIWFNFTLSTLQPYNFEALQFLNFLIILLFYFTTLKLCIFAAALEPCNFLCNFWNFAIWWWFSISMTSMDNLDTMNLRILQMTQQNFILFFLDIANFCAPDCLLLKFFQSCSFCRLFYHQGITGLSITMRVTLLRHCRKNIAEKMERLHS